MSDEIWNLSEGDSPIVATAVHNGHAIREELRPYVKLSAAERLQEEDPFTGEWTVVAPTRIVVEHSRFEVDVNRPRDRAVYLEPEDAWGLHVWKERPPARMVEGSLERYDAFYAGLERLYSRMASKHGRFVVLDLHSYNHRRAGPKGPAASSIENPQVNLGTGTLLDRAPWSRLIERFVHDLSGYDFPGGRLDVRENVKFRGGNCGRWTHERFAGAACVLSVEFKKFFMDEWSGKVDPALMEAIPNALRSTIPGLLEELGHGASRG